MPQEKILIKFEPKGHPRLIEAIRKLNVETKKLTGKVIENTAATGRAATASGVLTAGHHRLAATNGKLAMSFATLRSKMLLFTFAMSMGGRQAANMVKDFAKVEAMSVAFDTLSGGAGNAQKALTQLSSAAGGTMSKFDLLQQANNALILGVVKNSDEMNEMFNVAIKLGRAVGRTAKESVESLVTGIGRQSRLMLDNIGIMMNAEKAYTDYAFELGVAADSLTDAERRQAFLSATMEAAREKAALLGDDLQTMQERLEMVSASWDNLGVAAGGFLTEILQLETSLPRVADNLNALTRALDEHRDMTEKDKFVMKDMVADILVNAIPAVRTWTSILGINTDMFREMAESIDVAEGELIEFNRVAEESTQELAKLNEEFDDLNKQWDKIIQTADADLLRALRAVRDEMKRQENRALSEEIRALKQEYSEMAKQLGLVNKEIGISAIAGNLAEASISALANEMARLVMEGENLQKIKPGKIIGQMVLAGIFTSIAGSIASPILAAIGIAHKGGLIKDDGKVQRFATGGSVRGGDNVPILAQGGEFVMSRSAVQSVGIENLNRMNEGGGGSAVTVNVSGNVLSQDFVEGELAENIKEAIRRGTDFGIS